MSYRAVEDFILTAVSGRFSQKGDSFKLRHAKKMDGTECTPDYKDPAMTVTRGAHNWKWYCHRCGTGGAILDSGMSPKATLKKMKPQTTFSQGKDRPFNVPEDTRLMSTASETPTVPREAYLWLHQYGMSSADFLKYNIGWSQKYERIIIPIHLKGKMDEPPVAWVGRCPYKMSKADRQGRNHPKSLTIKDKNHKERVYFMTNAEDHQAPRESMTVIVEDIISAIKVHKAMGCDTIALLNAGVADELIPLCRGQRTIIWLDRDKRRESMQKLSRFRSLGVAASHTSTEKDPKEYAAIDIHNFILRDNKGAS